MPESFFSTLEKDRHCSRGMAKRDQVANHTEIYYNLVWLHSINCESLSKLDASALKQIYAVESVVPNRANRSAFGTLNNCKRLSLL